ncbi:type I restriction-modification system endonuclease [Rubritalea sp.]|uniref:type I restriction-modification system endonuclease n=1 Tax=Rubritalea sp. TaxID=2109375 RepID=UPI003EF92009
MSLKSPNFQFLAKSQPHLHRLAVDAERLCLRSPDLALTRLRQLLEGILVSVLGNDEKSDNAKRISELRYQGAIDQQLADAMHTLRKLGNSATHEAEATAPQALFGLKLGRMTAIWFHSLSNPQFKAGPFIPPQATPDASEALKDELAKIHEELAKQKLAAQQKEATIANLAAEKAAQEQYSDLEAALDLAAESEQKLQAEQKKFLAAHKPAETKEGEEAPEAANPLLTPESIAAAQKAFDHEMDEATTRKLIDQLLIDAGWEADSINLRHSKGTKPKHGVNQAIAEYPTASGPADYILFAGLTPIAAVEAKRNNVDVAGKIPQAQRYSRDFQQPDNVKPAYEVAGRTVAWPDDESGHYALPFVYSCNGKPFVKQLREKSGTWFRDVRSPSNIAKSLPSFHSPEGLLDLLKRDNAIALQKLQTESFTYLQLYDFQEKAIRAVENKLETTPTQPDGTPTSCLLAMATGTGKTRTIIGLIYRFLKAERFKRILFLVDRTSLGTQALEAFQDAPLEQNQNLSTIYNIAELGDMAAEAETRIQVATVQAMVQRVFNSDSAPNIDSYDCIIVDEAHRGYTLDQEMTEGSLVHRDPARYLSSYRRVLDYFDAVKIGLTATPAKHTSDIFGKPVFTYSYREAVADGWLIDHEPPIRYETVLSKHGIHFEKGDSVSVINSNTKGVELAELEDDLQFDVESFNRQVITESFNQVICEQLAQEFDPDGDEKVMIFCATDIHADMVKRLLDEEFHKLYGDTYKEASVRKITGKSDQVAKVIKRYKNERHPTIAITVDLLTTGIDVPKICHLVFLRRVRSRILYEQMIGRATRRCPEIAKTTFKIYDPVDIYAALEEVSTMKPLVKRPNIPLKELISELKNPRVHVNYADVLTDSSETTEPRDSSETAKKEEQHAEDVLNEINQKLMRVFRKAEKKAETDPQLKERLNELEDQWGVAPAHLHQHLHQLGPVEAANFFDTFPAIDKNIDEVQKRVGTKQFPIISELEDEFIGRNQVTEGFVRPEDYLDSFSQWIKDHLNESAALTACVTAPKDLTRDQLKEVKLLLDQHGYSKANLATAWRNKTNQDIAASIIGYIRQAALGEPLLNFEDRVKHAMNHIYALTTWSQVQKKWLDRLAKQLTHEVVIDHTFVNQAFVEHGGSTRLDGLLGKQLDTVLSTLSEKLWESA